MADDKEIKSSGPNLGVEVAIIIVVLLVVGGLLSGVGLFQISNPDSNETLGLDQQYKRPLFTRIFRDYVFELGDNVLGLKELQVRNVPGGNILGYQEKLALGRLMEGPIEKFDSIWWRVNFEEAPSGWVDQNNLTTRTGWAKFIYSPISLYRGFKPVGWVLSVILAVFVLIFRSLFWREARIAAERLRIRHEEYIKNMKEKENVHRDSLGLPTEEEFKNPRWEHIKELMKSKNQSDWRQAIIEADIILDEMLRRMGYEGLTIGDMLKKVNQGDFINLEKAWEAHKFRNEIAHTGSEFKLSLEEAERVIDLYRAIFDEFYYV